MRISGASNDHQSFENRKHTLRFLQHKRAGRGSGSQEAANSCGLLGVFTECKVQLEASGHKKSILFHSGLQILPESQRRTPKVKNPIDQGFSVSKTFPHNQEVVCEKNTSCSDGQRSVRHSSQRRTSVGKINIHDSIVLVYELQ